MGGLFLPPSAPDIRFYIDLGTGSLVIQILIASLAGALFLVKGFWKRILAFFKGIFSRDKGGDG
jgi:hypothetical protein